MQVDISGDDHGAGHLKLCSEEVNILIYLYLLESNFTHTAFALLSESALPSTPLFQAFNPSYPTPSSSRAPPASARTNGALKASMAEAFGSSNGKVPRGELIRKLWKALRWEDIERHATGNETSPSTCSSPFHLIVPHTCSNDGATGNGITSTPPSKRPEPFPPQTEVAPPFKGSSNESERRSIHREVEAGSPTVSGRTKRKSHPDSPASNARSTLAADQEGDGMPAVGAGRDDLDRAISSSGPAALDLGPAQKRSRDETPKESSASRSKSSSARAQGLSAGSKSKAVKGFSSGATGSGSWIEHRDTVTCLAWNPKDKEVLVTGSSDGTAKLWDFVESSEDEGNVLQLGKKPSTISHKSIDSGKKAVTALVWHPDGTVFATAASDGVGRLFTPSGQLQGILTYGRGAINSLKFNPSGTSLLAAKDDFTVCLFVLDFDLKSPKQLSFESHTKEVNDVDWLDDDVFASGGNDHTIFIYRANDRRPRFTLKGHTDDVTRVKWSPSIPGVPTHHRLLASVSDDGNIMVWKLPQYPADRGTVSRSLSPSKQPREKELSSDDFFQSTVAPGSEYCVNRLAVVSAGMENKRMNTLEWSPACHDGQMIVAAGGQDSTVKLFDALSGECLHVLPGLESGTGSIAFSPIGFGRKSGLVAGGGWDGKLVIWDVQTGEVLRECEIDEEPDKQNARDKPMMMSMAWRNDGQQLALGLHNKSLLTLFVGGLL